MLEIVDIVHSELILRGHKFTRVKAVIRVGAVVIPIDNRPHRSTKQHKQRKPRLCVCAGDPRTNNKWHQMVLNHVTGLVIPWMVAFHRENSKLLMVSRLDNGSMQYITTRADGGRDSTILLHPHTPIVAQPLPFGFICLIRDTTLKALLILSGYYIDLNVPQIDNTITRIEISFIKSNKYLFLVSIVDRDGEGVQCTMDHIHPTDPVIWSSISLGKSKLASFDYPVVYYPSIDRTYHFEQAGALITTDLATYQQDQCPFLYNSLDFMYIPIKY